MKYVTIYSMPTCGFCAMAKRFFKEHVVSYTGCADLLTGESLRAMMV